MPKIIELKTGLGYIRRISDGKIITKFNLPAGKHPFPDDVEVIEVSSKEELEKIVVEPVMSQIYRVYQEIKLSTGKTIKICLSEPVELTQEEIRELKKKGYKVEVM